MAITKLISPFAGVSGQVGGSDGPVLQYRKGRSISRTDVQAADPATTHQQQMRAYFAAAAAAWRNVTDAEAQGWEAVADKALANPDVFGGIRKPTAMNIFIRANVARQIREVAITTTAPTNFYNPRVTAIANIDYDASETTFIMNTSGWSLASPVYLYFRLSLPLPGLRRRARKSEIRFRTTGMEDSAFAVIPPGAGQLFLEVSPDQYPTGADFRIGLIITAYSLDYIPSSPLYLRSIPVTVT